MAMLAEPRRRQRFSTDPRGLNWSKDESKFGQKLMEKYGWSKGRGLGANEDGRTEHISISAKSDNRGVGCSKKHDDNWVAHQDDFNSLLASLNEANASSTATPISGTATPTESHDMVQVLSLEKKSSTSKRVHYHKFTRGKDLSRAGNHDMDCIFGRRKSKSSHGTPQLVDSKPPSDDETDKTDKTELQPDEAGTQETNHGVTTVATGESVQEYFARKMAEIQKARAGGNAPTTEKTSDEESSSGQPSDEDSKQTGGIQSEEGNEKKKKSKKRKMDEECEEIGNEKSALVEDTGEQMNEPVEKKKKKKKKSKKNKQEEEGDQLKDDETGGNCEAECTKPEEEEESEQVEVIKKKKKKKSKKNKVEEEVSDVNVTEEAGPADEVTEEPKQKKKKSKKRKQEQENESQDREESSSKKPKTDTDNDVGHADMNCDMNNAAEDCDKYASLDTTVVKYDYHLNTKSKKALENGFKGSNLGSIEGYAGGVKLKHTFEKVKKKKKSKKSKQ